VDHTLFSRRKALYEIGYLEYWNDGLLENVSMDLIIPSLHFYRGFIQFSPLIFISFIIIFVACSSGGNLDQPPTIRYGEDPCDECFMLINESRYAAGYVTLEGQVKRFDDVGCLLIYHKKYQENIAHFWVKDFDTQKWLKADIAFFVRSDSIQTPMGFGIIALDSEKAAKDIFSFHNHVHILKFQQLLKITEELYY
jgi:copper chaperone NosL